MKDAFSELLAPQRLTEVVDIGANLIDADLPYAAMLSAGLCRVTGFEPQNSAFEELVRKKGPNENYLPYAVGDGHAHTLNICRAPGMASLYQPDIKTLALFDFLRRTAEVMERVPIQTRKLDEISEITHLDFLKIDIQGGELAVFKNGSMRLAETVVIQTEISFVTLYENQPSLGEIDIELRRQGFIPHRFAEVKLWPISPCVINNDPHQPLHQLLEADIVYARDFSRPEAMHDEQLKHLALVAHHCYGSVDLALRCVMLLEQRTALPTGSQHRYMQLVAAKS